MNHLQTKIFSVALALSFSFSAYALELGQPAPDFSLPSLSSAQTNSLSQYRGQVVYLDFWASWCAPCRTSFPLLEELYLENKDQGFTIVAINLDENVDAADKFLQTYPATFNILRDANGLWADTYGIESMPTSYLIDKKGVIRHIHSGFAKADIEDIERLVKQWLAEGI